MKAKLSIMINPGFIKGGLFKELQKLGNYVMINGEAEWFFELKDLQKVSSVIGQSIEIERRDAEKAMLYAPPVSEDIVSEGWKGESTFEVKEMPILYVVNEFRKVKATGEVKRIRHKIPKQLVTTLWNVISKYQTDKYYKTRDVARAFCIARGDTRFITENRFDFQKFYGTRSKAYFPFYYSIKVLESKGLIIYNDSGIRKLTEEGL